MPTSPAKPMPTTAWIVTGIVVTVLMGVGGTTVAAPPVALGGTIATGAIDSSASGSPSSQTRTAPGTVSNARKWTLVSPYPVFAMQTKLNVRRHSRRPSYT